MSGIYISLDEDQQNVPDYLHEGIAFEFMDDQVTLPFKEAIGIIIDWCHSHDQTRQLNLDKTLDNLKKRFL
jgi:endonuclease IV